MEVFWFFPTHGDSRYLGTAQGARTVDMDYLGQIARAIDSLGYDGALIPTGRSCEDPWVAASALIPLTQRIKFLVAVRPGIMSPTVAARMASTFDRLSNGRLLVNVVTGGDTTELKGDGVWSSHDERYEITREFLDIWERTLQGESVTFAGKHIKVEDARVLSSTHLCKNPIHHSILAVLHLQHTILPPTISTSISLGANRLSQ